MPQAAEISAPQMRTTSGSYSWPRLPGCEDIPVWTGRGFRVGDKQYDVLGFGVNHSNWTDELTTFHEESAGDRHFIDRASRRQAIQQIKKFVKVTNPIILEVGCSSGFLLRALRASLPQAFLIGSDYVRGPLDALARQMPDLPLLQFDLVRCPLPSDSLDAVVLLNVLEHVEQHEAALRQVYRVLKPGGVAVIEVPAGPHLYDVYDKVLMHWRRYTLAELCQLTKQVGFGTLNASHLGCFLYPAFSWTKKRGQRLLSATPEVQKTWVADRIKNTGDRFVLHAVMSAELALGRIIRYGRGIRCLLSCEKPG